MRLHQLDTVGGCPRTSDAKTLGAMSRGLFCIYPTVSFAPSIGWNLYFHIAMMVNACSIKFRGCSRNGDISYAFANRTNQRREKHNEEGLLCPRRSDGTQCGSTDARQCSGVRFPDRWRPRILSRQGL